VSVVTKVLREAYKGVVSVNSQIDQRNNAIVVALLRRTIHAGTRCREPPLHDRQWLREPCFSAESGKPAFTEAG
jgi:hypothetical protein